MSQEWDRHFQPCLHREHFREKPHSQVTQPLHFRDRETEAQALDSEQWVLLISFTAERAELSPAETTFLKSNRWKVVELGLNLGLLDSKSIFCCKSAPSLGP